MDHDNWDTVFLAEIENEQQVDDGDSKHNLWFLWFLKAIKFFFPLVCHLHVHLLGPRFNDFVWKKQQNWSLTPCTCTQSNEKLARKCFVLTLNLLNAVCALLVFSSMKICMYSVYYPLHISMLEQQQQYNNGGALSTATSTCTLTPQFPSLPDSLLILSQNFGHLESKVGRISTMALMFTVYVICFV